MLRDRRNYRAICYSISGMKSLNDFIGGISNNSILEEDFTLIENDFNLFQIDIGYKKNLNIKKIDNKIINIFKENNFNISKNAVISKINKKTWLIKDDNDNIYYIEEEKNILNVYSNYIQIIHCFYYTDVLYSAYLDEEEIRTTLNGNEIFKYDIYLMRLLINEKQIYIIACPYIQMLKDIGLLIENSFLKDKNISFIKIDLNKLTYAIENDQHMGGKIKIKQIEVLITGDPAVNLFSISGNDTIHSILYNFLYKLKDTEYLFSLNIDYLKYFKEKKLTDDLILAFAKNYQFISTSASISQIDNDNWKLIDKKIHYRIKKIGNKLKIYIPNEYTISTNLFFTPRECSIAFNDYKGHKIILNTDRFGNYTFRIGKDALNLQTLNFLFSYFFQEKLYNKTKLFPPNRSIQKNNG